jgi:hypothetical protein
MAHLYIVHCTTTSRAELSKTPQKSSVSSGTSGGTVAVKEAKPSRRRKLKPKALEHYVGQTHNGQIFPSASPNSRGQAPNRRRPSSILRAISGGYAASMGLHFQAT